VSDDIRRLSDELARDPASLVFLQLGEALRRQGQSDVALKVALRGLERHPHSADAHDLLARIAVDRGELERAFDEWDMVLRLDPAHAGARKGLGFVCYRQGRLADAERYLGAAAAADPRDESIATALAHVRAALRDGGASRADRPAASRASAGASRPTAAHNSGPAPLPPPPRDPRLVFADVIGEEDRTALLLDKDGFVLAGMYVGPDGSDVAQEVGAELSGVSDEARRAMRHLGLGDWTSIVIETEVAVVALAPAPADGVLLVAVDRATPLGLVRRFLESAGARARAWLERVA
jgi:predicted regulator of Ras-like GTPase activity (Roadblock/LC7/MglB family)